MSKLTLSDLANLQNETTAVVAINANSALVETALENTLSRDGTTPNQMGASLDMNSHRIINLPLAVSSFEPLRLLDVSTLNGAGTITISTLPTGGTAGQLLVKNSSIDFDVVWTSAATDLVLSGNNTFTPSTNSAGITFTWGGFGGTWKSTQLFSSNHTNVHGSSSFASVGISRTSTGSGFNAPGTADFGLWVNANKNSFLTSTVEGEIDGIYVNTWQGLKGDSAAIIGSANKMYDAFSVGTGSPLGVEVSSRWFPVGATISDYQQDLHGILAFGGGPNTTNIGVGCYVESFGPYSSAAAIAAAVMQPYTAYYAGAINGSGVGVTKTTNWSNVIVASGSRTVSTDTYFKVTAGLTQAGDIVVGSGNASGVDGNATQSAGVRWTMKNVSGNWVLANNAGTQNALITQTGLLTLVGSAAKLYVTAGDVTDAMRLYSGSTSQYTTITVGTTSDKLYLGVAGGNNQFFTGTVSGDSIVEANAGSLFIGTNTTLGLKMTNAGVMTISAFTLGGTMIGATTLTDGIDLSASTISGNFLKGPGHFFVNGAGRMVVGPSGSTLSAPISSSPLTIHATTDENLCFFGHSNLANGVVLSVLNDAGDTAKGMEFKGSSFLFTTGTVTAPTFVATTPIVVSSGGTGYAGGAWTSFTSTASPGTGSFTTQASTSYYMQIGKLVWVNINVTISNVGTGAGTLTVTLPVAAASGSLTGREGVINGKTIAGALTGSNCAVFNYDNSSPTFANGVSYFLSGTYQAS